MFGIDSIIGGAAGAVSSLFGSAGKNRMIRQQMREYKKLQNENQEWFNRRYNEDATQRGDAQRLLTMTEDAIKKRNRAAAGTAAVMGGTEESTAAAKAANAEALANATSQIAANAEDRKDAIENRYLQRKNALNEALINLKGQKANGFDMLGGAIGGAAAGFSAGMGGRNTDEELKTYKI